MLRARLGDRIQILGGLIVISFVAVLVLTSQSAASFPTYFLALATVAGVAKWWDVRTVPLFWLLVLFFLYFVASALWSDAQEGESAVSVLTRSLLIISFVLAFAECQLRGQVQLWIARAFAVTGAGAAIATIAWYVVEPPHGGRIVGLGQLYNQVVLALVFGVVLIFLADVLLRGSSMIWRIISVFGAVPIALVIYLSDSRNAWFSVTLGLAVFIATQKVENRDRFIWVASCVAIVLLSLLAVLIWLPVSQELVLPRGLSFRPQIWASALSTLEGLDFFRGKGVLADNDVWVGEQVFLHPHSMYLSTLYHGGVIGLTLFLAILVSSVRLLLINYEDPTAKIGIGILAIALPAFSLDGHDFADKIGWTWFLLWTPVAIALGLSWSSQLRPR